MSKTKNRSERSKIKPLEPEVYVKAPVIDRLVYVLPWNVAPGMVSPIPEDVLERIKDEVELGKANYWRSTSGRYRLHIRLKLPDDVRALLSLGAVQTTQKGGLRIDITPSKMSKEAVSHLHEAIERILGIDDYEDLLGRALINRLDVAVDVVNVSLGSLLVGYKGVRELTVFGKRFVSGEAETINFGSVTSHYREAVYNKGVQITDDLIKKLLKAGENEALKDNLIRQLHDMKEGPPIVRFEVRAIKLRGVPLHQLKSRDTGRFERFVLCDVSGLEELSPFIRSNFMALAREVGLMAAVGVYKDCRNKKARLLIQKLMDAPPAWWQPDDLWARGVKSLRASGIFPKKAFRKVSRGGNAHSPLLNAY